MAQPIPEAEAGENRLVGFTGGRNLFLVSTEDGLAETLDAMLDDERNDSVSFAIMAPLDDGRWRVESITGTTTASEDYDHATTALKAVHCFTSAAPSPAAVLRAEVLSAGAPASEAVAFFLHSKRTSVVLAATVAELASLAPFLGQEHEIVIDLADRVQPLLV